MEKPNIVFIAQTSPDKLGVVNENYPGATAYVKKEGDTPEKLCMQVTISDILYGRLLWSDVTPEYREELINYVMGL